MATIDRLPGVYYEEGMTYDVDGVGSKIPVFIGVTGNRKIDKVVDETTGNVTTEEYLIDGTVFLTYDKSDKILNKSIKDGGILNISAENPTDEQIQTAKDANQLYKTIEEFYEESRLINSGDIGVPHIYVIDVGDGKSPTAWKNAYKTAKKLLDVQIEVYDGAVIKKSGNATNFYMTNKESPDLTFAEYIELILRTDTEYSIETCAKNLDLRTVFTTVHGEDDKNVDADLIKCIKSLQHTYSRLGLIEPYLFGKHIARICCTPANTEPGYYTYRSVNPGTFIERTKADMLNLQNNGIIFGRDEHINGKVYPKMNLCVSTSFKPSNRPADSLFHARFNADSLLNDVFEACYSQVKANESATNIAYLQVRINKLVNDRISAEEMVKWNDKTERGTKLTVSETDEDPYALVVSGYILPVKSTIAIKVNSTIQL